jgi:hypothetical protein
MLTVRLPTVRLFAVNTHGEEACRMSGSGRTPGRTYQMFKGVGWALAF